MQTETMQTEEKAINYLNGEECIKHSNKLQEEALENFKEGKNGVYIVTKLEVHFIQRCNFETKSQSWEEEEKEKIKKDSEPLIRKFKNFIYENINEDTSVLSVKSEVSDLGNFMIKTGLKQLLNEIRK